MRVPNDPDVIRAINDGTRAWVHHMLGECDPADCVGTHDEMWERARARAIRSGFVSDN